MLCCYSYPFCFQVSNRSFHFFSRVAIASGIFFVDLFFFAFTFCHGAGTLPCIFFFNSCVSRYHPQFLFVRSQEVEEGDEQAGKKRKGERSSEGEFSAIAFACCIHLRVGFSGFYFCTFCVFPHEPV